MMGIDVGVSLGKLSNMKTINRSKPEEGLFNLTLFPDNQPHVNLLGIEAGDLVKVIWPIKSSLDLIHIVQIADAIGALGAIKSELEIPYLMGARSDRHMRHGDSADLKVIASIINLAGFNKVTVFDPHNEAVTSAFIQNFTAIDNRILVGQYSMPDSVLIVPDAGAAKKAEKYSEWNPSIKDVVYTIKARDLENKGKLTIKVLEPAKCTNRNCVIIDDLCDAGGTFLGIASQILPAHLTLIVSHGIFSGGFRKLKEKFDHIITSDSYNTQTHPILTTIAI